jgi:hypothetical protein
MLHYWLAIMQSQSSAFSFPELAKYVFYLAVSAGVGWIVRTLPEMKRDVHEVRNVLLGNKNIVGDDGLVGKVARNGVHLENINLRHVREDVAMEVERDMSGGNRRRLRDQILDDREVDHG